MLVRILLLLGILCSSGLAYKILVICPTPVRSHNNLGKGIASILHNAKHDVTYVTAFPENKSTYREVNVPVPYSVKDKFMTFDKLSKTSAVEMLMFLSTVVSSVSSSMYENEDFKKILNDKNEKFDLVIVEYFLNDGIAGLGVKYDCPVIMISSVSPMHWLTRLTGNPVSPATVPNTFSTFVSDMTFGQRIINTLLAAFQDGYAYFVSDGLQDDIYKKYLPNEAAKVPFSELHKKVALVLSNSHTSLGSARPLLPNVVEIGGYWIGDTKELPEEYKKLLDNAKQGVIFFSMGSNLKSAEMPEALKNSILKALEKRKELVLWKYEEDLPEKPNNVIIKSWMPQPSILAHPNVKLFITHGGLLSTTEAASAGVPVLSIPIYGDQFLNAKTTQGRGCGVMLEYTNLTEASLSWALEEVIGNPKYMTTAKKVHQLFHDRPIKTNELVNYYVEHVIRTGGAKHLTGPKLPLYASCLLDVLVVILLPPLVVLYIIVLMCKKCFRRSKCQKSTKTKEKKH